jgi:hypothetical protein
MNNHSDSHYGGEKFCLDITGGSKAYATVEIYKCSYNANQTWTATTYSTGGSGGGGGGGTTFSSEESLICKDYAPGAYPCDAVDDAGTIMLNDYSSWVSGSNGSSSGYPQFVCLGELWQRESGWTYNIQNPTSGAFGIAQALQQDPSHANAAHNVKVVFPGGGSATDATVDEYPYEAANAGNLISQISWGLQYIKSTYSYNGESVAPCTAWSHETGVGWYIVKSAE